MDNLGTENACNTGADRWHDAGMFFCWCSAMGGVGLVGIVIMMDWWFGIFPVNYDLNFFFHRQNIVG